MVIRATSVKAWSSSIRKIIYMLFQFFSLKEMLTMADGWPKFDLVLLTELSACLKKVGRNHWPGAPALYKTCPKLGCKVHTKLRVTNIDFILYESSVWNIIHLLLVQRFETHHQWRPRDAAKFGINLIPIKYRASIADDSTNTITFYIEKQPVNIIQE